MSSVLRGGDVFSFASMCSVLRNYVQFFAIMFLFCVDVFRFASM